MAEFYALSTDDVRQETKVILTCWELLSPLDTKARRRVTAWLDDWIDSEDVERNKR